MQNKTEKPTQSKLKKAKESGDIAKSSELISALVLFLFLLSLYFYSTSLENKFKNLFIIFFSSLKEPENMELAVVCAPLLYSTALIMGGIFFITLFLHVLQTGWIWHWGRAQRRGQFRPILTIVKLGVIFLVGYLTLINEKYSYGMFFVSSSDKIIFIFKKVFWLLLKISLALLCIGIYDYFYQRWKHYKRMHMTPQEIKEEQREAETKMPRKSMENPG